MKYNINDIVLAKIKSGHKDWVRAVILSRSDTEVGGLEYYIYCEDGIGEIFISEKDIKSIDE